MEMDLAPFVGVVFDIVLFAFVFWISSVGAIFIWLFNRDSWKELGSFKVLGQATARSWLDTGLVAGILGTSVGMMGVVSGNAANTDIGCSVASCLSCWEHFYGVDYLLAQVTV